MSQIKDKLVALQTALNNTNKIQGIPAFIASDDVNEYEILKNRPGTGKIAIGFSSEEARVNFPGGDITGRVNQYFYATISRGRGLNQTRSDDLIYGSGGGMALYELAEILRDFLRAQLFDPASDEKPDYIGMEQIDLRIYGVDGIRIKFWVGTQLSMNSTMQEPV